MSVRENLIAAKKLIDTPEKWIKGAHEQGGCFCALGAIGDVVARDPRFGWSGSDEKAVIESFLPKEAEYRSVALFNDNPNTTHADIMALFQRAIDAQSEGEAP